MKKTEDAGRKMLEDVDDEEDDYREPDLRVPRSIGCSLRLEPYDGSSSWLEYLVYFEQMAELQALSLRVAVMALGLSLMRRRTVLVSLMPEQRSDLHQLTGALWQSFCPPELVYFYQAELKGWQRKRDETMAELGSDLARLVLLAYQQRHGPRRDRGDQRFLGCSAGAGHRDATSHHPGKVEDASRSGGFCQ